MAHILVIDDDEPVRGTLKVMLESGGHAVTLAVNGDDGLRRFQGGRFDLVLCDVFMPQKEGLETIRDIRRLSATIPIVSMSGSFGSEAGPGGGGGPDFLRMARALGATDVLNKPFRIADLLALIERCLGSKP